MFEKLVAAIDGDPDRSPKVVEAAKALALACGSEVLFVHVREVERPTLTPLAKAGAIPPQLHFESEEEAKRLVDEAVESLRSAGVSVQGQVGSGGGSTARELLEFARSFGANLILVGDRGSHVSDMLLGGISHRIVHLPQASRTAAPSSPTRPSWWSADQDSFQYSSTMSSTVVSGKP